MVEDPAANDSADEVAIAFSKLIEVSIIALAFSKLIEDNNCQRK